MFKRRIFRPGRCQWCGQETRLQRKIPEHLVHAVLTVLTCGLWGVSWLSISVVMKGERWRCSRCRAPQSEDPPRGLVAVSAEAMPEVGRGWAGGFCRAQRCRRCRWCGRSGWKRWRRWGLSHGSGGTADFADGADGSRGNLRDLRYPRFLSIRAIGG